VVLLEGLGKLEKKKKEKERKKDLIGNRTRDLPACSIVPQLIVYHPNHLKHPSVYDSMWSDRL
jgi:hypothetical protein